MRTKWGTMKIMQMRPQGTLLRICFCAVFPTMEQACAGFVYQAWNRWWDAIYGGGSVCGASLNYFCFCSQILQSTKISQWIQIPMWSQDLIFPGIPTSPGLKMTGGPIDLASNKSSPFQWFHSPKVLQGPLVYNVNNVSWLLNPPKSQVSLNHPRRQEKCGLFTQEQKLVLWEQFDKCMFLKKE